LAPRPAAAKVLGRQGGHGGERHRRPLHPTNKAGATLRGVSWGMGVVLWGWAFRAALLYRI